MAIGVEMVMRAIALAICLSTIVTTAWAARALPNASQPTNDAAIPSASYGPLSFNLSGGGDFYVAQNGKFVPAQLVNGTIEFHIRGHVFDIGYNGRQLNVCLAVASFLEVRADPQGFRASCLSGAMTGAMDPSSGQILVYGGKDWDDGNTLFSDQSGKPVHPLDGYTHAYHVSDILFVRIPDLDQSKFKGPLYGYLAVYRQDTRTNADVMPVKFIIE